VQVPPPFQSEAVENEIEILSEEVQVLFVGASPS
jgi:hypothetical protein